MSRKIKLGYGEEESSVEETLDHVGKGWHPLVRKLIDDLFDRGWDGDLPQIKEKLGGLRFYCSLPSGLSEAAYKEMYDLISAAEAESERTCEECGERGKIRSFNGWLRCVCDEHAKKGSKG